MQAKARFVRSARNPLRRSCASSARKMQARVRFAGRPRNPLPRSCVSSARNAGESAICPVRAQPSAEIVRVERARVRFAGCARNPLRRSCASSAQNAGESAICRLCAQPSAEIACRARETQARVRFAGCVRNPLSPLRRSCGRVREIQARVRFAGCALNPLRRSCVSSARNAGESAICWLRAQPFQPSAEIVRVECAKYRRECDLPLQQPSAEIVRVERAKCRRERDLPAARATLCGDRACRVRETQARVRFAGCARNPLRRSCVSTATQRLWLTTDSGSQLAGCHHPNGKPARWPPS